MANERSFEIRFLIRDAPLYCRSQDGLCCSFKDANSGASGFDCVQIPAAVDNADPGVPAKSNLCGNLSGLPQGTVCSEFFFGAAFEKKGICCEAHFFREEGPKTERADQNEKKGYFLLHTFIHDMFFY